MNKTRLR